MTNSISEIRDADCIFITGSNTAESHPVISYEVVRAARKGAHVIIIDPRRVPLVEHATLFLQPQPGTDIHIYLAMMHTIIQDGWLDEPFIEERTEGFSELVDSLANYTPERAALATGVPAEKIIEAARIYALGERQRGESIYAGQRGHSTILYAMGITQHSHGTDNVLALANLNLLCGQIGKPSTGVNPLRGQANVQGACDVGCLVNVLPGYQRVTEFAARQKIAEVWEVDTLPAEVGLTIVEATHAATAGDVRAIYVMGENPMMSDPNTNHVEEAFRNLDFLVVQDIFPSDTALLAHVVLPAASSLEKDGSFTNSERRVQLLHPVLAPSGEALPDWRIISKIAKRFDEKMGVDRRPNYWEYDSTEILFDELASATPIYAGMSHARLVEEGLQWPCPEEGHTGTSILHVGGFARGRGKFSPLEARDPAEKVDADFPLILTTGRVLYHYHSGTMTRRSEALHWREPKGYVEINAEDAANIGLKDGYAVVIESRRGQVRTRAKISDRVAVGTLFLAFHWREAPANVLTQDHTLDPVAKIPEYKVCAVKITNPRAK